MKIRNFLYSVLAGSVLLTGASVHADMVTEGEWEYSLAPLYLWAMSMNGSSQIGPVSAPLELDFKDDVFENLEAVFTLHFEAKKNDLTIFSELSYVDLGPSTELPTGQVVNVSFKSTLFELGAMYEVAETERSDWEVLGGLRYSKQELNASNLPQLPAPLPPIPSSIDVSESWWDVFIGGRVQTRITDKWRFVGRADIGTGGSDLVWNVTGLFDYRFKDWGSLFVGYKWMDYDYDNGKSGSDRYAFDAMMEGPITGLNFYW